MNSCISQFNCKALCNLTVTQYILQTEVLKTHKHLLYASSKGREQNFDNLLGEGTLLNVAPTIESHDPEFELSVF